MRRFGSGLAAAAILTIVILAGTAGAADPARHPVDAAPPATTVAPVSTPVTAAAVAAVGEMTVSVDIPCVRPKLQHCDRAHPDAP